MNANELADLIELCGDGGYNQDAAAMLREQQAKLEVLKKMIESMFLGLDSSINLNKAQAERKT